MSFDEVLRQGRQFREHGEQQTREADAKRKAATDATTEFRSALRELGRWFAAEARARRLPTVPFCAEPPKWVPDRWSKGFLGFGYRLLEEGHHLPPRSVAHGWALFPLHPADGTVHRGRYRRIGGRLNFDEVVGGTAAYLCLAVDSAGGVRVGAATEGAETGDYVLIGRSEDGSIMGAEPEELDPNLLVAIVNDLNHPMPTGLYPGDPTYSMMLDACVEGTQRMQREIVAYYAARAQQMLDGQ